MNIIMFISEYYYVKMNIIIRMDKVLCIEWSELDVVKLLA